MEDIECKKYPFNDDYMTYDYIHHRYILTEKCVFDELGINLSTELNNIGDANNTAVVNRVLQRVSRTLYSWIYSKSGNKTWQEFMLAKYPPLRDRVKEMLVIMTEYMIEEGDIGSRSGININKGSVINRDDLKRAQVPIAIEQMANEILPCGISLMYIGMDVSVPMCEIHRGY